MEIRFLPSDETTTGNAKNRKLKNSKTQNLEMSRKRSYSRKTRNSEITKNMDQKRPRTTVHFRPILPVHSAFDHKNHHFQRLFIIFIPITPNNYFILSEKILIGSNPSMAVQTTVSRQQTPLYRTGRLPQHVLHLFSDIGRTLQQSFLL
jgi:hypothetical protein